MAAPTDIDQLLGINADAYNAPFREVTLSLFRGCATELTALQHALASAENGQGIVVGLSGPPESGKSRLCLEFS